MSRSGLAFLTTLALAGSGVASAAAPTPPPGAPPVVYAGRLQDAQGRPIAGIYPLTFNLYKAEKGGKPAWSETHFVAVDDGAYAVPLGATTPLPKGLKLDVAWVGVALAGGKEIVRQKLVGGATAEAAPAPAPPTVPAAPPVAPPPSVAGLPPAKSDESRVDVAGFAYEAEHAKHADSVGGVTAADLKALARAQQLPPKAKIGSAQRFTEKVGGQGGTAYNLQCPPGYAVTGIQGTYESYVNAITLICTPLE